VFGQPAIYGPDNQVRQASLYSNRFLFTGREYNANFGFYEYRVRAYHPSLGCFMSEDPKLFDPGDYNLFRYCHNDPVDNVDPMGSADEKREPWYNHQEQAKELDRLSATEALWNRQMNFSSSFGAISYGMRAYAAEQAFKISVGIEATKRAEKATGKSQVPYSVATMRYRDTHTVAYGDPVAGKRTPSGGYEERIDIHHEKFAAFRANPSLWNSGIGWRLFVIGHTHPLLRSQAPGFSDVDRRMQAGQLRQYGEAVSLFKNNPTWPGHVYDARMMGPNGWEVTHWSEGGKLLGGPESD
jgi:RHS repeat-associated protein